MHRDEAVIGARVRQARRGAGLSLREAAQRSDVSPATLSAIENGKTGVSVARLRRLAAEFGTTVRWLIGDEQPTTAEPLNHRKATPGPSPSSPYDWRKFPPLDIDPVLAAAIEIFVETGYHGATMRSIAHRAGMSVPGVYHHYRDKQELLVRALDLTMDELHRRVDAARSEATTGRDRLVHVVEALALFHTHRRELAFIGASEMRSLTPANRLRIAESRNAIQYLVDDDIDAALAEEGLKIDHALVAGRAIATMCTSLPQWFRLDGPETPEQIAAEYAGFALGLLGIRRTQVAAPRAEKLPRTGR
ncbi:TetR family transcriptional regulator [Nocardia donostiensis]|uniref:Transcriptional regulator n=1 Tax=Nocardia donostiensis TaxID=1538463 RepID=A0A1V2TK78_9NOCA|nr:TetR family transcriptional regulator [Nocardia donostiensis]ONM49761.1 transcriptional regulator [Nocardia donostiensis]OQS19854.1 transcriptional regulator [Nocardia donostiensis]